MPSHPLPTIDILLKRLPHGEGLPAPSYTTQGAAGMDVVAAEDLDLMPGHAKMKLGGSHGGHNGLRDIQALLGTGDFWRLRFGIGHPGVKAEVVDYVLRNAPCRVMVTASRDEATA